MCPALSISSLYAYIKYVFLCIFVCMYVFMCIYSVYVVVDILSLHLCNEFAFSKDGGIENCTVSGRGAPVI